MMSLYDRATIGAALQRDLDPQLHRLLTERINGLATRFGDLVDYTHFLIVEPGDTEADIEQQIGFSPLVNPIDGARYRDRDFSPPWDWLEDHNGWFELIFTCGNSGFAYVLLIQDAASVPDDLLVMCREATR
jgi:hypothetical protein